MEILNEKQKAELVLSLLKEGRTYREIQSTAHVGPDFIVKVKKEALGENYIFDNPRTKNSKNTNAVRQFCDGKKSMEVALHMNMDSSEVSKAYWDYLKLNKQDRYAELLSEENQSKLDLVLMIVDIFHKKGIRTKEKVYDILKEIQHLEYFHQQINYLKEVKTRLTNEVNQLQCQENSIKKNIKSGIARYRYFVLNQRRIKKEVIDLEKKYEQLTGLINDIYDIQAYQRLEEMLINNIENVILEEDTFIPFILMSLFEALKSDPQKLESLNAYCNTFSGEKLRVDNIESRIDYLKNEKFWNDSSFFLNNYPKYIQ